MPAFLHGNRFFSYLIEISQIRLIPEKFAREEIQPAWQERKKSRAKKLALQR